MTAYLTYAVYAVAVVAGLTAGPAAARVGAAVLALLCAARAAWCAHRRRAGRLVG
jgi:hypothetical protein